NELGAVRVHCFAQLRPQRDVVVPMDRGVIRNDSAGHGDWRKGGYDRADATARGFTFPVDPRLRHADVLVIEAASNIGADDPVLGLMMAYDMRGEVDVLAQRGRLVCIRSAVLDAPRCDALAAKIHCARSTMSSIDGVEAYMASARSRISGRVGSCGSCRFA